MFFCALATAKLWAQAQNPEIGRIESIGAGQARLIVDAPRPLDLAGATLARQYGIIINSEDPEYLYSGDMKDVTAETVRTSRPGVRVFIPQGGRLEVPFAAKLDGSPQDVRGLLQAIVDAANAQFPFAFRLAVDGNAYTFIPTRTRDTNGQIVDVPALLDRKVSIPPATRPLFEHANLMSQSLSAQTGFHVGCCQVGIGGYPWGMEQQLFGADNEPARSVLMRLIRSVKGNWRYFQRCDPVMPGRPAWCFIQVETLAR